MRFGKGKLGVMPRFSFCRTEWKMMSPLEIEITEEKNLSFILMKGGEGYVKVKQVECQRPKGYPGNITHWQLNI